MLFILGEIKLPEGYCDADLTMDSTLEVLLPRRQGLGLCSTALASYLISLHNNFIYLVNKHTKEDDRYVAIPARHFLSCCITCSQSAFPASERLVTLNGDNLFPLLKVLDQSIRSS